MTRLPGFFAFTLALVLALAGCVTPALDRGECGRWVRTGRHYGPGEPARRAGE